MSVISEIKSHFESIESRHFWIQERLDQAARLANQHRYQADEIAEVLSANTCLLYTSPSPRDRTRSRMPSSA